MIVLRHDPVTDVGVTCDQQIAVLAALQAGVVDRPDLLASVHHAARRLAGALGARDSDAPELDASLKTALNAGLALFDLAVAGRCELVIGDKAVRLASNGPFPGVGPDGHRSSMEIAAILRDDEALAALAAVPAAVLQTQRSVDAVSMLRDRAVAAAFRQRPEAEAVVAAALRAVDDRRGKATGRVAEPNASSEVETELMCLRALVRGDSRELNQALFRALEDHKRRWSAPDAAEDALGFLAWGPLAIAAVAHDRGLRVEVQSDYVPLRLVLGDFDRQTDGFVADPSTTESGGSKFLLCALCGSPIGRRHRTCPTCHSELAHAPPVEFDLPRLAGHPRVPCRACGESILGMATVCPRCRTWQSESTGPDEVSLDAYPPEFQLYAVSRPYARARMAVLFPFGVPGPEELAARLPLAGYSLASMSSPQARSAPEAAWEVDVDAHGPDGLVRMRLHPLPLDAVPGFDRGALGVNATPAREALVVEASIGPGLLAGFARLLRFANAVAPDASGVFDLDAGVARPAEWLREAATSPVPPDPSALFAVKTATSPDGARAFVYTSGLLRCGVFELEAFDVSADRAPLVADLLDALGHVLIDGGETLPGEDVAIDVGGVAVCWVPAGWVRDRRPDAFGARSRDRLGAEALSVAVLGWDGRRGRPLDDVDLAGFRAPTWALDVARDRAVSRATLGRLSALRREHPAAHGARWRVRIVGQGSEPSWHRLVELDDDEFTAVSDAGERVRAPLDRVVGWEGEWSGGRADAEDALGEIVDETRRFVGRERSESAATPVITGRHGAEITESPPPARSASAPPRSSRTATPVPAVVSLPLAMRPHPRRALAAFVSLFVPGLGHVLVGDVRRGAAIFGVGVVTLFLFGVVNLVAAWECWHAVEGES